MTIVLAAVAVVCATNVGTSKSVAPRPGAFGTAVPPAPRGLATVAPEEAVRAAAATARGPSWSDLRARLSAAGDLHGFVHDALSRSADGGTLFAGVALDACAAFRRQADQRRASVDDEIARSGTLRATRSAAIGRWQSRCAAFTDGELDDDGSLRDAVLRRDDPMMEAVIAFVEARQARDATARRGALERIVGLREPLLLNAFPDMLRDVENFADPAEPHEIWLDGRALDARQQQLFQDVALPLALCRSSRPCKLDIDMELACATRGRCSDEGDYATFLRLDRLGAAADEVRAMVDGIAAAVTTGDTSSFMRPSDVARPRAFDDRSALR